MASKLTRLYTYAEAPVPGLVRTPKDVYMAAGYVAGLPGVRERVRLRAELGASYANAVLDQHHSGKANSAHPHVVVKKGDRTDYHVVMMVDTDGDDEAALAAAYSIEYGHRGRGGEVVGGLYPLTIAYAAMGGF